MLKKEFMKKYDGVIRSIAVIQGVDMGVATDMLIYEIRVHAGIVKREDTYIEEVDWKQAQKDLDSIID
ncbi:hypothetical protein [Aminipila sp.]|uniref:hypothetical protein n=1 Tax=Aminipila sp. TaxID=2060095 RepID=UPI00289632DC|nr:hypothetical protein [Aminipila sp.]